jgi:hypothetical protein
MNLSEYYRERLAVSQQGPGCSGRRTGFQWEDWLPSDFSFVLRPLQVFHLMAFLASISCLVTLVPGNQVYLQKAENFAPHMAESIL